MNYKRLFLNNGFEVRRGDMLVLRDFSNVIFFLDDKTIEFLKRINKISEMHFPETGVSSNVITSVLASKHDCTYKEMECFIQLLYDMNKGAALTLVLRELAILIDNIYDGSIQDSPEIYAISSLNGRVHKVDKSKVKNYRNFAAFRSEREALLAKQILRSYFKEMFKSGRK